MTPVLCEFIGGPCDGMRLVTGTPVAVRMSDSTLANYDLQWQADGLIALCFTGYTLLARQPSAG